MHLVSTQLNIQATLSAVPTRTCDKPGQLFDMKDAVQTITPEEGLRWHYIQTLAGDATDGYSGVPSIGIKRADALLTDKGCTWETIVEAFASKDLGEDVALLNARLAKILQVENYVNEEINSGIPRCQ